MKKEINPIPGGEVVEGDIGKYYDSRFLGAVDLIGLGSVEVTIDRVEHHDSFTFENGKTDENVNIVYFVGGRKAWVLHKTNYKSIAFLVGSKKGADWKGKKIKIGTQKEKVKGVMTDVVRVQG